MVDDTLLEINQIIHGLRPYNLESLGLESALRLCAHHFDSDALPVEFNKSGEIEGLTRAAEEALFRVAHEAIANAIKYSSAKRVSMRLEGDSCCVTLTIHDNGHGFNVNHVNTDPNRGLGLRNMKERIEAEGGKFFLTSSPSGTTIIATFPLN